LLGSFALLDEMTENMVKSLGVIVTASHIRQKWADMGQQVKVL
jgi:hypothetical protein